MCGITQLEIARRGEISDAMRKVAESEFLEPEFIREEVAAGRIAIPLNINHKNIEPVGIGKSLRTKINANIGKSHISSCTQEEVQKMKTAVRYGADTIMDLSTGTNLAGVRTTLIKNSTVAVGTVPIYEILNDVEKPEDFTREQMLRVIEEQAEQGVDYMTIHAGFLKAHIPLTEKRLAGIVSRGGAIIARWMRINKKENPFYEHFDEIMEICRRYDVTISIGDGLRPGCIADASDSAQFAELEVIGELVLKCREAGVQSIVEGPGHVPLDQIQMNMEKEEVICHGAPFYVLGPIVIDCAPGYDHITSSIGATYAAYHGASMLCYVTPKEHLGLPNAEDVRNGIIAYKIAAHAADVALLRPNAQKRDDEMSRARVDFDWEKQFELSLDPERAREYRDESIEESKREGEKHTEDSKYCTMCGPKFCSMRVDQAREGEI